MLWAPAHSFSLGAGNEFPTAFFILFISCWKLGGSESGRTEHPDREVVSSRAHVRARNVIHVKSGMKWLVYRLPFSLLSLRVSLFPSGFINLLVTSISESERICVDLSGLDRLGESAQL